MQLPFDKEFAGREWDCRGLCDGIEECGHAVCWKRGGGNDAGAIGSGWEEFANSKGARRCGGRPPPDVVLGVVLGAVLGVVLGAVSPSGCQGE